MLHTAVQFDARSDVRAMFQRVLAAWAVDALSLRRRGLDRPCHRGGAGLALGGRCETAREAGGRAARGAPADPASGW